MILPVQSFPGDEDALFQRLGAENVIAAARGIIPGIFGQTRKEGEIGPYPEGKGGRGGVPETRTKDESPRQEFPLANFLGFLSGREE